MDHQFKFGDEVYYCLSKKGIVIHNSNDYVMVAFNNDSIFTYPVKFLKVKTKGSRDISELKPTSDWIEINWDDESTLPNSNGRYLAFGRNLNHPYMEYFHDGEFANSMQYITHWQPLPKIPEVKHD